MYCLLLLLALDVSKISCLLLNVASLISDNLTEVQKKITNKIVVLNVVIVAIQYTCIILMKKIFIVSELIKRQEIFVHCTQLYIANFHFNRNILYVNDQRLTFYREIFQLFKICKRVFCRFYFLR